jgi:hypothetical protein
MSKLVTKLFRSFGSSIRLGFIGIVVAILSISIGTDSSLAGKPRRSTLPQISSGVYLYGEVNRPEVIGKEYIILEIARNKAIGAFYLPRSEFNCFYGRLTGSRLNLTLIDALDRQKYNYSFTLTSAGLSATKQPMMGTPTYQPLSKIGDIDRQILAACKLQLPNRW